MLLVVPADPEPPVGGERADAGQVPVELGGEEAGTAHLPVGDDVDPGLAPGRGSRGRRRRRAARRGPRDRTRRARRRRSPTRTSPDGRATRRRSSAAARGSWVDLPTNAKARAGLSTKRRCRTSASRPRSSISLAEVAQQLVEPRRAAERRGSSPAGRRPSRASTRSRWSSSAAHSSSWSVPFGASPQRNGLVVHDERAGRRRSRGGSRGRRPCRRG